MLVLQQYLLIHYRETTGRIPDSLCSFFLILVTKKGIFAKVLYFQDEEIQ